MAIKLIALDIDGTVVDRHGIVSEELISVINEAKQRGVRITLATGRRFQAALPIAKMLGVDSLLILHNGAEIVDCATGRPVRAWHLPGAQALAMASIARRRGIGVFAYANAWFSDKIYYDSDVASERLKDIYPGQKDGLVRVASLVPLMKVGVLRLVMYGPASEVTELLQAEEVPNAKEFRTLVWNDVKNNALLVEVLNRACSKGKALEVVAGILGIPREQVLAIGDHVNDLEMLRYAGIGVAMGDSPSDVSSAADVVTGTVEEGGAAAAIREFVLGQQA